MYAHLTGGPLDGETHLVTDSPGNRLLFPVMTGTHVEYDHYIHVSDSDVWTYDGRRPA